MAMIYASSTLIYLLADCDAHGIRLALADGGRLRYSPRSAVTPDLLDRLESHSGELIAIMLGLGDKISIYCGHNNFVIVSAQQIITHFRALQESPKKKTCPNPECAGD